VTLPVIPSSSQDCWVIGLTSSAMTSISPRSCCAMMSGSSTLVM